MFHTIKDSSNSNITRILHENCSVRLCEMFSAKNKKLIKTKFNEFKAEADGLTDQSSKGRALRSIQQFDSVFKSLQGLVSLIDVSI
jgi:hypothetical protein